MNMKNRYFIKGMSGGLIKRFCVLMAAVSILIPAAGTAFGKEVTYIDITNPLIRKIPLAATSFKKKSEGRNEEADSRKALEILEEALAFTGYIKIIDHQAFIAHPAETGITRADIDFKDWTGIGAELLVTGGIKEQDGNVRLWLRLFDTFEGRLLVGKIYSGHREDIRTMIHRFCSEISYVLTGEWGVFRSSILFVSTVAQNKEVFVCDFDGHNPEQVTHHKSISLSPAWSHDSEWIAYTSYARGKPDIYIKNLRQKRGAIVNREGMNIAPSWLPGKFALAATLSFSGDQEIYLLTGNGKIIKKITDNWGIDISPVFSPDGKKVAFVSKRGGTPQIYMKDMATGTVRRLTFEGNYNTSPDWSPNGDKLAYVGMEKGNIDIYTVDVDDGEPVQLTMNAGDNEDPSWSPDGSLIAFSSTREGAARIYVMTAAGSEQRRLLKIGGAQTDPAWSKVSR